MTVHKLVSTFANTPREIHVILYGLAAVILGPKMIREVSEEPQYLLVSILVALGYKHYRDR